MLELTEYGSPVLWKHSLEELDVLRLTSRLWKDRLGLPNLPFQIQYIGAGKHSVRAGGVTGFIRSGDLAIEIRPKFLQGIEDSGWRRALWHILSTVDDVPDLAEPTYAAITSSEQPLDVLGWVIANAISSSALRGLPRGYESMADSVTAFRGKLNISRISEIAINPSLLPCVFDTYSYNVPVNRLLCWACRILSEFVASHSLSKSLLDCACMFNEVSSLPPGLIETENILLPAQYDYLRDAVSIARILQRQESLEHYEGDFSVHGFLWNSSDIYERYIRHLLVRICERVHGWSLSKASIAFASQLADNPSAARNLYTIPDFTIHSGGRAILSLDAKYKVWQGRQPNSSDAYQSLAAGRAHYCNHTCLIYPTSAKRQASTISWKVRGEGFPILISALFVDIMSAALSPANEIKCIQNLQSQLIKCTA